MTILDLIQMLASLAKNHRKRVVTLAELCRLCAQTPAAVAMTLLRAQKKNIVGRAGNVWINLMDRPTVEEVAFALEGPSYISFESALYHHGILSQSPRGALTVATCGRPRLVHTPLGPIRFTHLKGDLFFGYDKTRMALAEKAWLDLLYVRGRKGEEIPETLYLDTMNRKRLKQFARSFPRMVQRLITNTGGQSE